MFLVKESRRTVLTRRLLRDSLVELMQNESIHKISIKQICETANVNRTTFYAHYCDRYELLEDVERETAKCISAEFDKHSDENEPEKQLERFFKYIIDNIERFRVLLRDCKDNTFALGLAHLSIKRFIADEKFVKMKEDAREFIYQYIITGSLNIIEKLIKNEIDKNPGEIARMFKTVVNGSIGAFSYV